MPAVMVNPFFPSLVPAERNPSQLLAFKSMVLELRYPGRTTASYTPDAPAFHKVPTEANNFMT